MNAILLAIALFFAPARAAAPATSPVPDSEVIADVLERWDWLDVDVQVSIRKCGMDNAAYFPATHDIVMCEELFNRPDLAKWVLAHELGHAFMWQHEVPQREGTPDQERVADELAFLMSTDDENTAAARWFLSMARTEMSDGVHPAALDRAASLLCLQDGKDDGVPVCRAYFKSMLAHWVRIMDGYL